MVVGSLNTYESLNHLHRLTYKDQAVFFFLKQQEGMRIPYWLLYKLKIRQSIVM